VFRHEGPTRSERKNTVLAAYLAFVAGYVNSSGFLLIGSFTSHVTGSIGRLGNDIATHELQAALFAILLVVAFFVGAVAASLILATRFASLPHAYGTALLLEALAVASFVVVAMLARRAGPRVQDLQAALLCFAMGMQNSMVTRLSGSVVRTTHLTGVVTDLGIEVADWLRWLRKHARGAAGHAHDTPNPRVARMTMLLSIVLAFTTGAALGASTTLWFHGWAMFAPALMLVLASLYAYSTAHSIAQP
jgi:uncharacterized membrane protein YoaK (UPF0700 family)